MESVYQFEGKKRRKKKTSTPPAVFVKLRVGCITVVWQKCVLGVQSSNIRTFLKNFINQGLSFVPLYVDEVQNQQGGEFDHSLLKFCNMLFLFALRQ